MGKVATPKEILRNQKKSSWIVRQNYQSVCSKTNYVKILILVIYIWIHAQVGCPENTIFRAVHPCSKTTTSDLSKFTARLYALQYSFNALIRVYRPDIVSDKRITISTNKSKKRCVILGCSWIPGEQDNYIFFCQFIY